MREEPHVELGVARRVHHRQGYVAQCSCQGTERVVRGGPPVTLIPRASLSVGAIACVVTARYLWGLPLHRITTVLKQYGARVSDGTLVARFTAREPRLQPLYDGKHSVYAPEGGAAAVESALDASGLLCVPGGVAGGLGRGGRVKGREAVFAAVL